MSAQVMADTPAEKDDKELVQDSSISSPVTPKLTFPDGGLRAWLVCMGSWGSSVCTFGYISSFGVYQSYYQHNQLADETPSNIAWIGSLQLFFILSFGLFTGRLYDAGYHSHILVTGSILLVISIFTTAECTKLWHFILAQGIVGGLGSGLVFQPSVAVISHWFSKRRALAYGIIATGSSTGGVVFPIVLSRLLPKVGFQWAVRIVGFMVLIGVTFACLATKSRLPPRQGGKLLELHHLRDPAYGLLSAAAFVTFIGLYTFIFYISTYALAEGIDSSYAFYLLSILNASSVLGRLLPNIFADKLGPANILWPASAIAGVLNFAWPSCQSSGAITAICCLYGPASGSYVSTFPALVASETERMNEIGSRMALGMAISGVAALIGSPIMGAILRAGGGSFVGPAYFSGGIILVGCGLGFASRHIYAKRRRARSV